MIPQVKYGLGSLYHTSDSRFPIPYIVLGVNLLSQLICVSGVNQLSAVRRNPHICGLPCANSRTACFVGVDPGRPNHPESH